MRLLLPHSRQLSPDDLHEIYSVGESICLRAGFVVALDGGISFDGSSRPLRTATDEAAFHALRAVADAVVVGAGTARAEGYGPVRPRPAGQAWRHAQGLPGVPPLVIVSRSLNLDPADRCFSGPSLVVTCAAADPHRRSRLSEVTAVIVAGEEDVDLSAAVTALHERGLVRLLCEGGPQLLTALLQRGLVDELCLTLTPLLLGAAPRLLSESLTVPQQLELRHLIDGDGVLLTRYALTAA